MYPAPIAGYSLQHPWKHPSGASKFLAWWKKNNIRGNCSSSWSFCNFHLLPSCLGHYVMICATRLWSKSSKSSASLGDESGPNNGWPHLYITSNMRRFLRRNTNWQWMQFMDGTLVVVCDTALGTISLWGIRTGVIGWDFLRFLHFVIIFSSWLWQMSLPWLTCWRSIGSLYTLSKSKPGAESQS
jgi:hypothetical protein